MTRSAIKPVKKLGLRAAIAVDTMSAAFDKAWHGCREPHGALVLAAAAA